MDRLVVDLHTHTIASGHAFSTVLEMVGQAAHKGLKMIALTDHGLKMPGGPNEHYFCKLLDLPRVINGVEVLKGVEANILDEKGNLDMPAPLLERLDVVLAGFHNDTGYLGTSIEENTRAMIATLQHPLVHVITHPGNPEFPVDIDRVVQAAKMAGKALEINNSSLVNSRPGSAPRCAEIAKKACKMGVFVTINSDAHNCFEVGQVEQAYHLAQEADIYPAQVLNTSVELVREYLYLNRIQLKKTS